MIVVLVSVGLCVGSVEAKRLQLIDTTSRSIDNAEIYSEYSTVCENIVTVALIFE